MQRDSLGDAKTFLMFVGWGRSGHSFVGQALNAHRQCMIANEGQLFDEFQQNPTKAAMLEYLARKDKGFGRRGYKKAPKFGNPQDMNIAGAETVPNFVPDAFC